MIIDSLLQFDSSEDAAGKTTSTNVVDLSIARDAGLGEEVFLVAVLPEALVGGGLTVSVEMSDDEAFSAPVETQVLGEFAAAAEAGSKIQGRLQPGQIDKRFMRIKYTAAAPVTDGKVSCFMTKDIESIKYYDIGYEVS